MFCHDDPPRNCSHCLWGKVSSRQAILIHSVATSSVSLTSVIAHATYRSPNRSNHPNGLGRSNSVRLYSRSIRAFSWRCDQADASRTQTVLLPTLACKNHRQADQTFGSSRSSNQSLSMSRPEEFVGHSTKNAPLYQAIDDRRNRR